MRRMRGVLALLLLCGSSAALAHAHLLSSTPAAGSRLTVAPAALTLAFSEAAQLTALSLTRNAEAPLKLTAPATAQTRISVALPVLTAGTYLVRFRALASDGHLVPGEFSFTVAP